MAVHLAGDYGDDAAAGMKHAAEENGLQFTDVDTQSGQTNQAGAIQASSGSSRPGVVTTGPTDLAVIVGRRQPRLPGPLHRQQPHVEPRLLASPPRRP